MEFSYAPDFIVKRKRKRSHQPLDPALGYYPAPTPPQEKHGEEALPDVTEGSLPVAGPSTAAAVREPHSPRAEDSSRIQPRPSTPEGADDTATPVVTVEDFLRWSVAAPQPRSAKKPRYVDLRVPPEDRTVDEADSGSSSEDEVRTRWRTRKRVVEEDQEYQPSDSDASEDASLNPSKAHASGGRSKKALGKFSARMLRAAVLTGVDLGDANDVVSTDGRAPLKFDIVKSTSSLGKRQRQRSESPVKIPTSKAKWRLVDPRKATLPKVSVFPLVQKRIDAINSDRAKHISRWRPSFPGQTPSKTAASQHVAKTATPRVPQATPVRRGAKCETPNSTQRTQLTFVPLEVHERAVKTMFHTPARLQRPKPPGSARATPSRAAVPLAMEPLSSRRIERPRKPAQSAASSPNPLVVAVFPSDPSISSPLQGLSSPVDA